MDAVQHNFIKPEISISCIFKNILFVVHEMTFHLYGLGGIFFQLLESCNGNLFQATIYSNVEIFCRNLAGEISEEYTKRQVGTSIILDTIKIDLVLV